MKYIKFLAPLAAWMAASACLLGDVERCETDNDCPNGRYCVPSFKMCLPRSDGGLLDVPEPDGPWDVLADRRFDVPAGLDGPAEPDIEDITHCNGSVPETGSSFFEVPGNGQDDDCDGEIDELEICDCDSLLGADPLSFAQAIGICDGESGELSMDGADQSRLIADNFGIYRATWPSCKIIILSTGRAGDHNPQGGTDVGTDFELVHSPNPAKYVGNPYSAIEPNEVHDYTDLQLTLRVPQNARAFAFDFVYLTSEYPEFSCSRYNDTFVALLESEQLEGNISFDSIGNTIQVNTVLFVETDPAQMSGTGYDETSWNCESMGERESCEKPDYDYTCTVGGSTGWLTTTSPATPGETIKLTLAIFDEGDGAYDSMVIIDNFRWKVQAPGGPCTGPDCP